MSEAWIEPIGKLILYAYGLVVLAILVWIVIRVTLGNRNVHPAHVGGTGRFLLEYVGNVDVEPKLIDRRRNRQARVLMDRVRQEMRSRDVGAADTEQLMEDLREAVRTEGQGHAS